MLRLRKSWATAPCLLALAASSLLAAEAPPAATKDRQIEEIPPTFANVAYGADPAQVLDVWLAQGPQPTPVVFSIHGGGWIHGPKEPLGGDRRLLARGISVVHITYRFTPAHPLPAPVADAARALQFVRSKAGVWHLDRRKVILSGFSAGGCTALWLATHPDLAQPDAVDPVARESTRVSGAMIAAAQTTIEPDLVRDWVGLQAVNHSMLRSALGFKTNAEMFDAISRQPAVASLYREYSPLTHLSPDDPPLVLEYGPRSPDLSGGIHGAEFGIRFKQRADELGITTCWLKVAGSEIHRGFPGKGLAFVESLLHRDP